MTEGRNLPTTAIPQLGASPRFGNGRWCSSDLKRGQDGTAKKAVAPHLRLINLRFPPRPQDPVLPTRLQSPRAPQALPPLPPGPGLPG